MPLLPTTELWRASIEGRPDLVCEFAMPIGSTDGQARMRAWHICTWARGGTSNDPAMARAAIGLRLELLAVGMAEVAELSAAA